jgi:hypothetical protein
MRFDEVQVNLAAVEQSRVDTVWRIGMSFDSYMGLLANSWPLELSALKSVDAVDVEGTSRPRTCVRKS